MPFDANAGETGEPEHDEREVIDLTADDNDTTEMGSSNQVTPELQPDPEVEHVLHELAPNLTVFAYDERDMTFHELLTCLTLDELKSLAKQLKLKTTQNVGSRVKSTLSFIS
jgi:Fanconi-associated nuclease 1